MCKLLFASLIAAFQLWTPAAQALDLMQAYQQALASDPVYAAARYALQAGAERSVQGRAGLLPAVAARGTLERADIERGGGSAESRTNSYALVLSQPLLRWVNWEQYQQSKLSVAASEAEFAQAQQDLVVRVANAYFDVLAAQDTLASVQAQKVAITEQLASAQRNFEVGTATITDTHEAQARFDLTVAQELAAESELDLRRAALEQLTGAPAGDLAQLRQGVVLQAPEPAQITDWVTSAQSQNYGVIGAQLSRAIAQREIRKSRAEHLPTVDLVASRSHNNRRGAIGSYEPVSPAAASGATDSTSIGIEWNIPLFSGFATTSRVREAVSLEGQARADLETVRRNAAQGARQAYLGVHSGLAQVRALEAAELSSRSALESNQLGYEVGVRINIDVLNAQQQLYETRRDLAQARYNTLISSLQLKAAAGILSEDDLAQINQLLSTDLRHTAFQTLVPVVPLVPSQNASPPHAPARQEAPDQELAR